LLDRVKARAFERNWLEAGRGGELGDENFKKNQLKWSQNGPPDTL
jgi:hypothetical protein